MDISDFVGINGCIFKGHGLFGGRTLPQETPERKSNGSELSVVLIVEQSLLHRLFGFSDTTL
jgi:hypothetical protein